MSDYVWPIKRKEVEYYTSGSIPTKKTGYVCPHKTCNIVVFTMKELGDHVKQIHEDTDLLRCKNCLKSFNSLRYLVKHKCPYASPRTKPIVAPNTQQVNLHGEWTYGV